MDELRITHGSFRTALLALARATDGQVARIRLVLTSRPIAYDLPLTKEVLPIPSPRPAAPTAQEFADIAMGLAKNQESEEVVKPYRIVELVPLNFDQIKQFAASQSIADPEALLADIRRRSAMEFAERPQDLLELCSDWRANSRISSHREQVRNDISVKLKPRTDRREPGELSQDRAFDGASRLALAAAMMRRLTIRHSVESDSSGPSEIAIDPAVILSDWTPEERVTLLERALFGVASYGRVRFHHRSVIEFLAAHRLVRHLEHGKPVASVKRLLLAETAQGEKVVRPTMRPVSAWVAIKRPEIFEEVLHRDPLILTDLGDPDGLTSSQKERVLMAYVQRYGSGGWRRLHVPAIQVRRFATPDLGPCLRRLWPTVENPEVRELLLNIIAAAKIEACADIAFDVVVNATEPVHTRLVALSASMEIMDPRLEAVVRSIESDPVSWPEEVARPAVVQLFPDAIQVDRFLRTLARLGENETVGDLNYHLVRRIDEMPSDLQKLDTLRRGLAQLVSESLNWVGQWPHYRSCRPFLLPALAITCTRLLDSTRMSPDFAASITLALRLTEHDQYQVHEEAKALRTRIASLEPYAREIVFWAEDAFCQEHHPIADPWHRMWASVHHGPIAIKPALDEGWILAAIRERERPTSDRAMMIWVAWSHLSGSEDVDRRDYTRRLRPEVVDSLELAAIVDGLLKPAQLNAGYVAQQEEWERTREEAEKQKAKDHESWVQFKNNIVENAGEMFRPDRAETTVWNIWRALSRSGSDDRALGWNRTWLESHFGKAIADKIQEALRPVWRKFKPTLRSERAPESRNTFSQLWQFGFAAITAESEATGWAVQLTPDEAQQAARYAPIQLNGLPSWLDDLIHAHPTAVDPTLGAELSWELSVNGVGGGLLQDISHGSGPAARFFRARLLSWLDKHSDQLLTEGAEEEDSHKLGNVIKALQIDADFETIKHLRDTAVDRLQAGLDASVASLWLPLLMRLDPDAGTSLLEQHLGGADPTCEGAAAAWIAALFKDGPHRGPIGLSGGHFTPQLLLRLVRLAYQHVPPSSDTEHRGFFTPTTRDDAQHARNALLSALLEAKGPDAWAAKLELAADPMLAHIRDRIFAVAREQAAQEVDGEPMSAAAVVAFESRGEAPPRTRDDMFQLLNDRIDDLHDLLLRDWSPRELWATIEDERQMRREIARHLDSAKNGLYTVDQEAVTADEKETDIRLISTATDQRGIIELKIGDKRRSAADLRGALSEQLVMKYMAPANSRAGCLLITLAKPRTWKHPDTGGSLDFPGLIAMLNENARRIADDLGGAVRVVARALDLRPRLETERTRRKSVTVRNRRNAKAKPTKSPMPSGNKR